MTQNRHEQIIKAAPFGYAYHEIIVDPDGTPVDYRFLEVNEAFSKLTGLDPKTIIGKTAQEIFPGNIISDWISHGGSIALDGGNEVIVRYFEPLNKWYQITISSNEKGFFSTIFIDVTLSHLISHIAAEMNAYSIETIVSLHSNGNFYQLI